MNQGAAEKWENPFFEYILDFLWQVFSFNKD